MNDGVTVSTFVENCEEKFRAVQAGSDCVGVGYTEDEARKALADALAESMRKPVAKATPKDAA